MGVETAMRTGFFKSFESELGLSVTTGYDWAHVSSQTQSNSVTTTVEVEVPAYTKMKIQAAQGNCDRNTVHTDFYKTITTNKAGDIVSETVESQIYGKIISEQESYDSELLNDAIALE